MINTLSTQEEILNFLGKNTTLSATIEVTKRCNLRCRHCAPAAGKSFSNELTLQEVKKVIDDLKKLGVLTIVFTGGEPFLRQDFLEILEYTHKKGIGISILTNGLLIDSDILNKLRKFNIKLIRVSLDGPEKIHDAIRGVKGSWRQTIKSIRLIRNLFKGELTITAVMMKENWKVIDKVLIEAVKLKADVFSLLFFVKVGRAAFSKSALTVDEYRKGLKLVFNQYKHFASKIRFSTNIAFPFALLPPDLRKKIFSRKIEGCTLSTTLMIKANGDVGPCDCLSNFPEMIIGNIRDKSLVQIIHSTLIKNVRSFSARDLKGVCRQCIYCNVCRGGCRAFTYGEYGTLIASNPVCQKFYEAGYFPRECLK